MIALPVCPQETAWNCGPSALRSVLAYFDEEVSEERLAIEAHSTPEAGTSAPDLVATARRHGLTVHDKQGMGCCELRDYLDNDTPVLLAITDEDDVGHWVVAVGYTDANVYLHDPADLEALVVVSWRELESRWYDEEMDGTPLYRFGAALTREQVNDYVV